jgi:hypothetical protein
MLVYGASPPIFVNNENGSFSYENGKQYYDYDNTFEVAHMCTMSFKETCFPKPPCVQ